MTRMPRIVGVIQARMASTRMPGKILAPVAGVPLLQLVVARTRAASVDEWWIATTTDPSDDVTEAWGRALGVAVLRGDPRDVLSRFAQIVRDRKPEWLVRLTADNPYVDAPVIDRLLLTLPSAGEADHLAEGTPRGLPLGYVPEAVRATAILELAEKDLPPHHRAHVTSALRAAGRTAAARMPSSWPQRPTWRWTVDTAADLEAADAAFRLVGEDWSSADYPTFVAALDRHPEIIDRNAGVPQKAVAQG